MPNAGPPIGIQRFLSIEILASLAVSLVAIGILWGALTTDVEGAELKIQKIEEKQDEIQSDVGEIKTDVEVIKANQEFFKEELKEMNDDTKLLLRIIERNFPNGDHTSQ